MDETDAMTRVPSCFSLPCIAFAVGISLAHVASEAEGAERGSIFVRSQALETDAMGLLLEHFNFEESLLAPDNDRLTIFVSVPHGARMVLDSVTLYFDEKQVVSHRYNVDELQKFLGEATQQIFMTRVPQGQHSLRLDIRTVQGLVRPMKTYTFTKGKAAKFIDLQIAGDIVREVSVVQW